MRKLRFDLNKLNCFTWTVNRYHGDKLCLKFHVDNHHEEYDEMLIMVSWGIHYKGMGLENQLTWVRKGLGKTMMRRWLKGKRKRKKIKMEVEREEREMNSLLITIRINFFALLFFWFHCSDLFGLGF